MRSGNIMLRVALGLQHPCHLVSCGGIFLEKAGHNKDAVADTDFNHAIGTLQQTELELVYLYEVEDYEEGKGFQV